MKFSRGNVSNILCFYGPKMYLKRNGSFAKVNTSQMIINNYWYWVRTCFIKATIDLTHGRPSQIKHF